MFKTKEAPETPGLVLSRLIKVDLGEHEYVPGIGSGAIDGVIVALSKKSDEEIVRIIRMAAAAERRR